MLPFICKFNEYIVLIYQVDSTEVKLERAQITLNDCLACSGCVTSAETVLITQQSQDELYRILRLKSEDDEVIV